MSYRYFSCGHSHCPLCQGNKRKRWYERVEAGLLTVPYQHITFTLPHELNGLCRGHPKAMYNLLFRVAWQTIRGLCADPGRVGGLPGMTAVLHTWGSDLKQHVHLHCLVTFGGLDEGRGRWSWPRSKARLLGHRVLRNTFRRNFLAGLKSWMTRMGPSVYHQSYGVLTAGLGAKSWCVNQQPPTTDAATINAYLSRYICRIGIWDARLRYDKQTHTVAVTFKDYRRQVTGQAAPLAVVRLPPLVAMARLLQHVLPAGFHRSRSYGLHAANTRKRLVGKLRRYVRQAPDTVLVVLRIVKALLKAQLAVVCTGCGSVAPPVVALVAPDRSFIESYLRRAGRAPPPGDDRPKPNLAAA